MNTPGNWKNEKLCGNRMPANVFCHALRKYLHVAFHTGGREHYFIISAYRYQI